MNRLCNDWTTLARQAFHAIRVTAWPAAAFALCLVLFPLRPAAAMEPVESPAAPGSLAPDVAVAPGRQRAVMTWLERVDEAHALRFAVFENGAFGKTGTIARGTDWFANWADTPRLFVLDGGGWLAHWLARSGDSTYAYEIRLSRSTDRGRTWSDSVRLHRDASPTEHGFASYFREPGGTGSAVWLDGRDTGAEGGAMTLRTARIDDHGPSSETLLDDAVCDCCQTASAVTDAGPVVVYRNRTPDEIRDIWIVRRIDGDWTDPRPVHADGWNIGGCPVNGPAVVADGRFVAAAWFTMADGKPRVHVAVSDDAGASFGEPATLSPGSALGRVQLALHRDDVLVTWMDERDAGAELRLARFDRGGKRLADRSLATLASGRVSGFPRIAVLGDRLLIAWTKTLPEAARPHRTRVATAIVRLDSAPPTG